jgi:hypothetical protein
VRSFKQSIKKQYSKEEAGIANEKVLQLNDKGRIYTVLHISLIDLIISVNEIIIIITIIIIIS